LYFRNARFKYVAIQTYISHQNIIISVYKSNQASYNFLEQVIEKSLIKANYHYNKFNLIIAGDFNIDLNEEENYTKNKKDLIKHMQKCNFHFITPLKTASTNNNTQIDFCISNNTKKNVKANYFESVFSYHKPIWVLIEKK
jgi:endonuclease/exonuclease/phosphatase family metal-dependent hydrolase